MSSAPLFSAARSRAWIHYALEAPDPGAGLVRTVAWVASEGTNPELTVSQAASWAAGGVYLFLGEPPSDDRALLAEVRGWLSTAPEGIRFLWIANPSAGVSGWDAQWLRVRGATSSGASLQAGAELGQGGYSLSLPRGCTISMDEENAAFIFGNPLRLAGPADDPLPLSGDATLPLRGDGAGAFSFSLEVGGPSAPPDPLAVLDAGIRFYHPAAARARGVARDDGGTFRYPVLDLRSRTVTLHGLLDPVDLLGERSMLTFASDTGPLASHLRTAVGQPLTLAPVEGAGFRFLPFGAANGGAYARLTLAPVGTFDIGTAAGPATLLCGISGVEYLGIPAAGATIRFIPGYPAWAPLFRPDAASGEAGEAVETGEAVDAPRLTADAVTSWAAVSSGEPVRYFAQPRDAVLHGATADGLYDYFAVPAATLPPAGAADESAAFPFVPYAGIDAASASLAAALEAEVLAPERRERIHRMSRPETPVRAAAPGLAAADAAVNAVAPNGFLATFSADRESWHRLILARSGNSELALENITDPLRSALLTSDQFLVVSDPTAVAAHLEGSAELVVDGWTFALHPREWVRHGTILILKSADRSLAELVNDVGTWVLPDTFNRAPADTQRQLEEIIADVRTRAEGGGGRGAESDDPWVAFLRDVVDSPSWGGWLALRCSVPPDSLPLELRELAAGIEADRFFAHHLGASRTPLSADGQTQGDSALFGLIAYDVPPRPAPRRDASFQVTSIRVSLVDAAVRSFSARIALTVGTIFGARTHARDGAGAPVLLLEGTRQRRGDRDVYVFRNASEAAVVLEDRTVASVRITRCELSPGPGGPSDREGPPGEDEVVARFSVSGSLAFHPMTSRDGGTLDLIGFDELPFSGLVLTMRFPMTSPGSQRFDWDVSGVTFEPTGAVVRRGSLTERFPLRPRGMLSSAAAARPADLGWSTLIVPDLEAPELAAGWFGLRFDLDLGTPGALAEAAGLSAGLGVFWTPSVGIAPAMVGLRLPGASGGTAGVSLMGVIDLRPHRQQLLAVEGGFLLKLTGITATFLGKALPPEGSFDMLLFGDPGVEGGGGPLGWYGAYHRPKQKQDPDDDGPPLPVLESSGWSTRARLAGPQGTASREPGGDGAPPPAWRGRPWAWTLIQSRGDEA